MVCRISYLFGNWVLRIFLSEMCFSFLLYFLFALELRFTFQVKLFHFLNVAFTRRLRGIKITEYNHAMAIKKVIPVCVLRSENWYPLIVFSLQKRWSITSIKIFWYGWFPFKEFRHSFVTCEVNLIYVRNTSEILL